MGELVIVSRAPTGEGSYCIIGEWTSLQKLIEVRPQMIAIVDTFRDVPAGPRRGPIRFKSTTAPKRHFTNERTSAIDA